ncbi:putative glycerophosphocholine acyltransferase 1 [Helianthus annuus]|nr:putative glycerophosphocholine acyltransferase 1 [Helianthus annuus]
MSSNEDTEDYQSNGHGFQTVKDRSRRVAETKEKTKEILSKQAVKIAKQAEEHESFITKVHTYKSLCGFFNMYKTISIFAFCIMMVDTTSQKLTISEGFCISIM